MLKMIKLSEIVIADKNYSRGSDWYVNVGDAATLAVLLLPGWDAGLGVAVVTKATGADHYPLIGSMMTEPLDVKVADKVTVNVLPEDVRKHEWTSGGKYELVSAFRRLSAMPLVNAIRERLGQPVITEIPCEVVDFADVNDRIAKCLGENGFKTTGSKRVVDSELLRAAKAIFENGGREAHLTKGGLKRGTSQKLWSICRADHLLVEHGEPSLIRDIEMKNVEYGPLDAGALRKAVEAVSVEGVQEHLRQCKVARVNEVKMMAKKDMESLRDQTGNKALKYMLAAILANDTAALRLFAEHKEAFNGLMDRINPA